ncbi:MAG TPA: glycosyltransferase family 39 protein [Thermoanaerobaculia bacterium]|nr:glycosyltransferase family 39 protein [Thermoanaerobaculia bacterium]
MNAGGARSRLAPVRSLALVLVLFAFVAGALHAGGRTLYNADQAVAALMAQDILYLGAHPVFFDGSEYAGTLEQHLLALAFAVLPDRPAVQHLVVAGELAVGIALLWLATRRAFGARAALGAGLYLALGPYFLYYRGLSSTGPYTPLFALGAAALALLVRIEGRAAAGARVAAELVALGVVLGLAWWTHPAAAAYAAAAAAALATGAARRLLAPAGALLMGGFALGSLPWWLRNLETGWASVRGPDAATLPWRAAAGQVGDLLQVGVPVLLGGRPPWAGRAPLWVAALALLVLAVLVAFAVKLMARRSGPSRALALGALTLLVVSAILALLSPRTQFTEPRVLIGWYVALAPLAGALLAGPGRRAVRAGVAAALAVLHLAGYAAAPRIHADVPPGLVEQLARRGIDRVYASYWTAYPLTFLSAGRIVGSPFGQGTVVRRPGDRAAVDSDTDPAFLFDRLEPQRLDDARRFAAFLHAGGHAFRHAELAGGLALFWEVAPGAVEVARRCFCIPSGLGPEAVLWRGAAGPRSLPAGATARYHVRVTNGGALPWSRQMRFAYHWRRPDGSDAVFDGRRTLPPAPPAPGETITADVVVTADVPPGEYQLVLDVVEEGVAWWESLGSPPLRFPVRVDAAAPAR